MANAKQFTLKDLCNVPGLGWCGPRYREALALEAQGFKIYQTRDGYIARRPNQESAR